MARYRAGKAVPPARRGLDVSRYRSRPRGVRNGRPEQRAAAWQSFRSTKLAIKMLVALNQPVTSRSIEEATDRLSQVCPSVLKVSAKTVLHNEMCRCLFDAWTTTKSAIRSTSRPSIHIPQNWKTMTRSQLMVLAANYRQRAEDSERGRIEAIRKQRAARPAQNSLAADLARLTTLAASLGPAVAIEPPLAVAGGPSATPPN